jgi:mRNA-degrading endonuclease YafQ of YafQ-DinJ toxin-antitoxin module
MGEQEQYKQLLKKIIKEAENMKIQSSEEIIQTLVNELANLNPVAAKAGSLQKTTF